MFGDYASNLMFLPNPTRRELLHFVAGGGLIASRIPPGRVVESRGVDDMMQNHTSIQ